ncbi:MAG TPA: HNH endonuclease [Aridibacter sp.]|nr:HNH endonuclease [Aridibacter sp.]
MINSYVGITDRDWFETLKAIPEIDEVNFWKPGGKTNFAALKFGEVFLFKLHAPHNFIVGGGIFAHFSIIPISIAWEAFGVKNGARTFEELRARVERLRHTPPEPHEDYRVGCILLEQPFFFEKDEWIPAPDDWKPNIVQGKTYDLSREPGLTLWKEINARRFGPSKPSAPERPAYGEPTLIRPRLGQGAFRIVVTDGYERRCAFSGERTLPALGAAQIQPYEIAKEHRKDNGLLLRKDLHALFDKGYLTVAPDRQIEVSKRIKEEFENGRDYYKLHGEPMREPKDPEMLPNPEFLEWHNGSVYKG